MPSPSPAFFQGGFVRRCFRLVLALQRHVHLHQLTRLLGSCWRFEIAQEFNAGASGHSGLAVGHTSALEENKRG